MDVNFKTAYNQFYICDSHSTGDTASESFWTTEAYDDRLAIEDGILGVGTECYGPVKCKVNILESVNNDFDLQQYDHVVEGGLIINSGTIQILDCPNSAMQLEIPVKNGDYRVRIYSSNLSSVNGDEGDDFYFVEIWPGAGTGRIVLKRYQDY